MTSLSKALESDSDYYLIGELAYLHEGDFSYAQRMIAALGKIRGVSAVKQHMLLDLDEYITPTHPDYEKRRHWIWSKDQHATLIDQTCSLGLEAIVLADDMASIDFCVQHPGVAALEIHAVCLHDRSLMEKARTFPGPVLLGIGGIEVTVLEELVQYFRAGRRTSQGPLVLMYGIQTYPTQVDQINLRKMIRLGERLGIAIGYCDHTSWNHPQNILLSTLGYTLGFPVLEKHFSLEPGVPRIDHEASIGPEDFEQLVRALDSISQAKGNGRWELNGAEKKYGTLGAMRKVVVARRPLSAGEVLTDDCIALKRVGTSAEGLLDHFEHAVGRELVQPLGTDEPLRREHLAE